MRFSFREWCVAMVLLAQIHGGEQTMKFHVSRDGNDANPGTEVQPFASLERARAAVRAVINRDSGRTNTIASP